MVLFKKNEATGVPAIIVNDKVISQTELENLMKLKPQNMKRLDFIDSLITREILIQKALSENIQKEESFRKAIQDHYENLLISILKDRKYRSIDVKVSNIEVYRSKPGKKVSENELEIIRKKLNDKKTQDVFDDWINGLKKQGKIQTIEQ